MDEVPAYTRDDYLTTTKPFEYAERAYMKVLIELEQVKRENETLKHALQNWHEED